MKVGMPAALYQTSIRQRGLHGNSINGLALCPHGGMGRRPQRHVLIVSGEVKPLRTYGRYFDEFVRTKEGWRQSKLKFVTNPG